jgi:hypothetical protein
MARKKADDTTEGPESPLVQSINPDALAVTGTGDGTATDDTRVYVGTDRKHDPAGPGDVSAIADPDNPMVIMDAGADPDFAGA